MKYLSIVRYVLIAVSVIIIGLGVYNDPGVIAADHPWVSTMLNWTYFVMGVAILLVVGMPIIGLIQNPIGIKRTLIGIGLLLVLVALAWVFGDSEPVVIAGGKEVYDNPTGLKVAGMSLFLLYLMLAGAILSIVFGEIYKQVKK